MELKRISFGQFIPHPSEMDREELRQWIYCGDYTVIRWCVRHAPELFVEVIGRHRHEVEVIS